MSLCLNITVPRNGFEVRLELLLEDGRTLAIMGPNGAGKSTVLHAIAGTQALKSGSITLNGRLLSGLGVHLPPHRRAVGLLSQQPRLFPHLDATQNIAFAASAAGRNAREAKLLATQWLERLGLGAVAGHRPAALSGGQQQRVALARALAAEPQLLLVDEPFAALDVQAAVQLRELLRAELTRSRTTAVLVTHAGADALALAEDLVVIERGQIVQFGPVAQVLAAPETEYVRAVAQALPHSSRIKESQERHHAAVTRSAPHVDS